MQNFSTISPNVQELGPTRTLSVNTTIVVQFSCFITVLIYPHRHCPESVRWLIANERYEEAKAILDEAAECNGVNPVPMEIIMDEELKDEDRGNKKPTMCQYVSHFKTFMFLAGMVYLV